MCGNGFGSEVCQPEFRLDCMHSRNQSYLWRRESHGAVLAVLVSERASAGLDCEQVPLTGCQAYFVSLPIPRLGLSGLPIRKKGAQ
jgi:hypothetical protein